MSTNQVEAGPNKSKDENLYKTDGNLMASGSVGAKAPSRRAPTHIFIRMSMVLLWVAHCRFGCASPQRAQNIEK